MRKWKPVVQLHLQKQKVYPSLDTNSLRDIILFLGYHGRMTADCGIWYHLVDEIEAFNLFQTFLNTVWHALSFWYRNLQHHSKHCSGQTVWLIVLMNILNPIFCDCVLYHLYQWRYQLQRDAISVYDRHNTTENLFENVPLPSFSKK